MADTGKNVGGDMRKAASQVWAKQSKNLLHNWIFVPFGIVIILYFVVALDRLIKLGATPELPNPFPASVACLLILFFALLLLDRVLPKSWMEKVLAILNVPVDFALGTMNLYFTPGFIRLPLSPATTGGEIGRMIGVFIIGYIAQFILTGWTSRLLQLFFQRVRKSEFVETGAEEGERLPETEPAQKEKQEGDLSDSGDCSIASQDFAEKKVVERSNSGSESDGSSTTLPVSEKDDPELASKPQVKLPTGGKKRIPALTWQVVKSVRFSRSWFREAKSEEDAPIPRPDRWANLINNNFSVLLFLIFFLIIGIPVYASTGYSMPIFICLTVLMFQMANAVPKKIKRIAHPVLVSSFFTVWGVWIIALTRHNGLHYGLRQYQTQNNYLQYFRGAQGLPYPGAGDILGSMLDASIVALAMPMYKYRRELWHYFIAIVVPNIALTAPSLLAYPIICYKLGMTNTHSLAFAPRSVTLALAQICSNNLGGDFNVITPIAVVSGISGPIFGPTILKMIRIPDDDYVTKGVVLGANSSAIATAMLLEKDRRAAALSSLSMSVYGILFVVLTSIPAIVSFVRSTVGL